jgi:hypothetical protein
MSELIVAPPTCARATEVSLASRAASNARSDGPVSMGEL